MIDCKIISMQNEQNFTKVSSAVLPTQNGFVEILPNHAEAFVKLIPGNMVIKKAEGENTITIGEAICHIKDNQILILQ